MTADTGEAREPVVPAPRSAVLLVGYGIAGGIFVLYVIGWIIGIPRAESAADRSGLTAIMTAIGTGVTIASGPLWFACVFLVTRRSRTIVKLAWLAAGVVLLVPLPLLIGAAHG